MDFIPSSIYLSVADAKLRLEMGAERMLSDILEPVRERYDYILIDTCPSLESLTINALAAVDEVIVTVNLQLLAMMGLQDFLRTAAKIKRRINPGLEIAGILLTMCDARTTLCRVLTEEVRENFHQQIRIFETRIPKTVKVGESVYYYAFMRPLWREDRNAQNREPMESLEKMAEDLSFEPGTSGSMEDDVTAEMLLEELIRYLDGVKPGYGGIFRMLYEGYESADIQKKYDLKKSTANYQIRKIRELAAAYINE